MSPTRSISARKHFMRSILEGVGFTLVFALTIATTEIGNRVVDDATAQSLPAVDAPAAFAFDAPAALALASPDDAGLATGPITDVAVSLRAPAVSAIPREFELRGPLAPAPNDVQYPAPAHSGARYYAFNTF